MDLLEENRQLRAIVEAFDGLILICSRDHRITYMNEKLIKRTGRPALGEECFRIVHDSEKPCPWCGTERTAASPDEVVPREIFSPKDGRWYLRTSILHRHRSGEAGRLVLLMDISEQKEVEEALRHRERFEALIATISTRFIHLPSSRMDEGIEKALEELGRFFGVSRCVIFSLDDEEEDVRLTHEWSSEGKPEAGNRPDFSVAHLPWLKLQLSSRKPICVPSIAELPKEAAREKALWQRRSLKSFVAVPILAGGQVFGMLGLGCEDKERSWDEKDIRLLGTVGEIFGNTLENQQIVKALQDINESLEGHIAERTRALEKANRALRDEIDQHRHTSEELHKLSRAVEQSPVSILITDTSGTIEYVNPKFCEISGYSPEEAIGNNPRILRSELTPQTTYETLWQNIASGREWKGEFLNRRKDGTRYWEKASISPVRDAQGEIAHYLAVKEDVTERKRLEELLVQEKTELETAQTKLQVAYADLKRTQAQMLQQEKMASIGVLAAGVAHEINNPIGFIASNLTTLGKYCGRLAEFVSGLKRLVRASDSPEIMAELDRLSRTLKIDYITADIQDLIHESLDGTDRVKKIVQALKTFSRQDDSEPTLLDINACVENALNMAWNELKYKGTVDKVYGDIPPISGYPHQLGQVFINLLLNAAQAIEGRGHIRACTFRQDDHVVVTIADTGCGIPPENIQRLFEPFFTTKDVGQGTGLGLSICYEIIRNHGGTIWVESKAGEGTTFFLSLPV